MTLDEAKKDMNFLLEITGRTSPGQHVECCFHSQRPPGSLRIWQDETGACWFKCYNPECSGAKGGSVVDAYMILHGCDFKEAVNAMHIENKYVRSNANYGPKHGSRNGNYGGSGSGRYERRDSSSSRRFAPPPPPPIQEVKEPIPPVPDHEKMNQYLEKVVTTLLESKALQDYLLEKRKIVMAVADQYMLGVDRVTYRQGKICRCQWVIPITDENGEIKAIKTHWQNPPLDDNDKPIPKGGWKKVGTEPQPTPETPNAKPRHGWATMWPPPEYFDKKHTLFIFPGELKAACALSMGMQATSITVGENWHWTPGSVGRIEEWSEVAILYDPDEAGEVFLERSQEALRGRVGRILSFNCKELLRDCEDSCLT